MPLLAAGSKVDPDVSVIIPLHTDGPRFRRCLESIMTMPSKTIFEVVVVTDRATFGLPSEVISVTTRSPRTTSPAVKRDRAFDVARGRILAFIDDDAYPRPDWLDSAAETLKDEAIHAVGGPGLTPPDSTWRERLGGAVYESILGSGPLRHRFVAVQPARDSDDLPAYNLLIRREALATIGGWSSTFYGGEDTKVCHELVTAGFRLRYDPRVVVYHHRRPVLRAHLQQVANVGRHRGFFVRRYPRTSFRLPYFAPTLATLVAVPACALLIRAIPHRNKKLILSGAAGWLFLSATVARRLGPAALLFPAVLIAHHLAYGGSFIRGLLSQRLES
jgi:glycosyltransferase involved in cell wall biosynthesis